MPHSFAEDLADELTGLSLDLSRLGAHTQRLAISQLRLLQRDLETQIRRADLDGVTRSSAKIARMNRLLTDVKATIRDAHRRAEAVVAAENVATAATASSQALVRTNRLLGFDLFNANITTADFQAIAKRETVLGLPARDYWNGQAEGTRRRFTRLIRQGVLQGRTTNELVQDVVGRRIPNQFHMIELDGKLRRIPAFSDGILSTTINQAETLVRTSVQSVSNQAIKLTYDENEDIIKGYAALTTLDARTSDTCIARTGASWDLEGNPLPESTRQEQFPGPPPWHFRCRSILGPIPKSWEEMVEEQTGRKLTGLRELPAPVRASMDGEVPTELSFGDFLRRKGDTFASRKLGPTRFRLWKEGKLPLSQLIDQAGRPLSASELVNRFGAPNPRPRARSTPRTASPQSLVNRAEDSIATNEFETAMVFDPKGTRLLVREGTATKVRLNSEDLRLIRGNIVTHNHPRYPTARVGSIDAKGVSFSIDDLTLASRNGAREMRAVSEGWRHSIKPRPGGTWPTETRLKESFDFHKQRLRTQYMKEMNAPDVGKAEYVRLRDQLVSRVAHNTWRAVSRDLDMIYSRVAR